MDTNTLKSILDAHSLWIKDQAGGLQADLSGADLSRANLSEANLSRANLSRATLYEADLSGADLFEANLSEANLYEANLSRANLSRATLSKADLSRADLYEADLSGANLSKADLSEANLSRANLSRANLSGAYLYEAKGINKYLLTPLYGMMDQEGPIRAYKIIRSNGEGIYKGGINYLSADTFEVTEANTDEQAQCGTGINLSTLDWCVKEWTSGYRILIMEFSVADIAAIPIGSDGKFRVYRCKKVGEKDLKQLGLTE